MALAVAALLVALDRLAVRRNLAEVARLLGAQDDPLTVEAILSHAVGDPGLRVGVLDGRHRVRRRPTGCL